MKLFSQMVFVIISCAGISVCSAQPVVQDQSSTSSCAGLSQHGSSGFFLTPSPSVLPPGQVGGGITGLMKVSPGRQLLLSYPLSFVFGIAKQVEAYASFNSRTSVQEIEESQSMFGLKVNFLQDNFEQSLLSAALQAHRMEIVEQTGSAQTLTAFSGKLLLGASLFNASLGYLDVGYRWVENRIPSIKSRMVGGIGVAALVNDYILSGVELRYDDVFDADRIDANIGIKIFLLEHIQLSAGVMGSRYHGTYFGEGFVGVSLSTERFMVGRSLNRRPVLLPEPPPLEDLPDADTGSSGSRMVPPTRGEHLLGISSSAAEMCSVRIPSEMVDAKRH